MSRFHSIAAIAFAILIVTSSNIRAQDFRVYTQVYDESTDKPEIVARSLTLFHHGKVYDYVESASEVVMLEPNFNRMTILNPQTKLAAQADFAQIRQMLKIAREMTAEKADEFTAANNAPAAAFLRFQLEPNFEESFDAAGARLQLSSPYVKYAVRCDDKAAPEAVDAYLKYADWMSQVNFVLHPQSMLPDARLALNDALRRRQALPLEVKLDAEPGRPIHLRAVHQVRWQLDGDERKRIHEWETLLKNKSTRIVTLKEYQQAMLLAQRPPGGK